MFKKVDDYVNTDALASTQLIDENIDSITWTNKEKDEQNLVSVFIKSSLSELGIHDYEQVGPLNVCAGHLAHLQTQFKIPFSLLEKKKENLLQVYIQHLLYADYQKQKLTYLYKKQSNISEDIIQDSLGLGI